MSSGRNMMQALELLQLAKRHVSGWSSIYQWRNQACSCGHCRSGDISWLFSQSVSQSVSRKFCKIRNFIITSWKVYSWSEDIFWLGYAYHILPRFYKVNKYKKNFVILQSIGITVKRRDTRADIYTCRYFGSKPGVGGIFSFFGPFLFHVFVLRF